MEWITWACCAVSCCLLNADHRMPQNITIIMVERYVAWLLWSGHTIIISSSSSAFAFIFAASEDGFKFKKKLTIRTLATSPSLASSLLAGSVDRINEDSGR